MFRQIINRWVADQKARNTGPFEGDQYRRGIRHGIRALLPINIGLDDEEFRRQIKNISPVI